MNKGELTLLDRKFDFTRMGVYSYIKEASGVDPFEFINRIDLSKGNINLLSVLVDDVPIIIYAGINTALDVEGKENIDLPTAKKIANSLLPTEMSKLFEAFIHGLQGEPAGEKEAPVPGA